MVFVRLYRRFVGEVKTYAVIMIRLRREDVEVSHSPGSERTSHIPSNAFQSLGEQKTYAVNFGGDKTSHKRRTNRRSKTRGGLDVR